MSNTQSFIKVRILAGIIGGLVSGGIMYVANLLLDTSFSNTMIIISAVITAIIFGLIVKPRPRPDA